MHYYTDIGFNALFYSAYPRTIYVSFMSNWIY